MPTLGSGSYGCVVPLRKDCIKRCDIFDEDGALVRPNLMEAVCAAYLSAQPLNKVAGIIEYKGIRATSARGSQRARFNIRMERGKGGSLHTFIRTRSFSERLAVSQKMFEQVAGAIIALHDQGITHGDLKPANIVVTDSSPDNFTCKIVDLGAAVLIGEAEGRGREHDYCTYAYAPPESFTMPWPLSEELLRKHDAYSLGVIMYEFIYKEYLFDTEEADTYDKVREVHEAGGVYYPKTCPVGVPQSLFDTMMALLEPDPQKRPTLDAVFTPTARYKGAFFDHEPMDETALERAWGDERTGITLLLDAICKRPRSFALAQSMCNRLVYASESPCSVLEARACAYIANVLIAGSSTRSSDCDKKFASTIVSVLQKLKCRVL